MSVDFIKHNFEVENPERLDKAVTEAIDGVSRGKAQAAIRDGRVQ